MEKDMEISSASSISTVKWGIIFLHGSGDTGHGLYEWINSTHLHFFSLLHQANVVCRFPNSPKIPFSLFGGEITSAGKEEEAADIPPLERPPPINSSRASSR
jgi:hypothetical protein